MEGYGATPIKDKAPFSRSLSLAACQAECEAEAKCDGIVMFASQFPETCWLHTNIDLSECVSFLEYDVWVRDDKILSTALAKQWGQCGGKEWEGPTQCVAGLTCVALSEHYFQCMPHEHAGKKPPASKSQDPDASKNQAGSWGQCGGLNWEGPSECIAGYMCKRQNDHYSQCSPATSPSSFLSRKRFIVEAQ